MTSSSFWLEEDDRASWLGAEGGGSRWRGFRRGVGSDLEDLSLAPALFWPLGHTKVLSDGEERVELVLSDVNFSMIHEVEHSQQVGVLNAFQVQKRVLMWIILQHAPEEGAAGGQYHLVGLDLVIVTG